MTTAQHLASLRVVRDVLVERARQHAQWGEQDRLVTGAWADELTALLDDARRCQQLGEPAWNEILIEEVCEALLEDDPEKLRAELVQVAAVAVQWIEALDREAAKQEAA